LANGVSDLFLLVMMRIGAVRATQNHGSRKFWVAKLARRSFASRRDLKPARSRSEMSWRIFRGTATSTPNDYE
jgi:hypothetical protein